jgi:hypothetical protein
MNEILQQKKVQLETLWNDQKRKEVRKILKNLSWMEKFNLAQCKGTMIKPIMKSFIDNEFENGFIKLPKHKQKLFFLKEKKRKIKNIKCLFF